MLHLVYNIIQLTLLVTLSPLLLLVVLVKPKYRSRIPARLGFGLSSAISPPAAGIRTVWLHALSVGEITSAVPLLKEIRKNWPTSRIVVTISTATGNEIARQQLADTVDVILPSPLDIRPVVSAFLTRIKPDVYIQVETDFWPNILHMINHEGIPAFLVNGRTSQTSLDSYARYSFFFKPMFLCFNELCMQTERDSKNMAALGVPGQRIHTLGNLKFDTPIIETDISTSISSRLPGDRLIITAGSTHDGEEKILLETYKHLLSKGLAIYLIVVPRNPKRSPEIAALARESALIPTIRTESSDDPGDLFIVDTIGELMQCYLISDIAFVGGSLVNEGGHNPIEPALAGIPVIFGEHMEDFHEVARHLTDGGGSFVVRNDKELTSRLKELVHNDEDRRRAGNAARRCIENQRGVIAQHIELIRPYL